MITMSQFSDNPNPYAPPQGSINYAPPQSATKAPAGFWIRVLAQIVDALCLLPLTLLAMYAVYTLKSMPLFIIVGIPGFFFKPLMESFFGGTPGKLLIGLRVVDSQGERISIGQAYLRFSPWIPQSVAGLFMTLWLFNQPEYADAEGLIEVSNILNKNPLTMITNLLGWIVIVDCVVAAFNERKQAVHDMLAQTYVIYK
jgi:uncharacterized RDD family membrane protein YckC